MLSGIYVMNFNSLERSYYVGYSQNLVERKKQHYRRLVAGTHYNYLMQNTYNLVKVLPEFEVIEHCPVEVLGTREIYWIKEFDSYNNGYNLSKGGEGGAYGEAHYNAQYKEADYINLVKTLASRPEESITAICKDINFDIYIAYSISTGASHAYLEEIIPLEYNIMLNRVSKRNMGMRKYSKDVYIRVFLDLVTTNMKHKDLETKYEVSSGCIEGISSGDTHRYLKEDFPDEYNILLEKKLTRRNKSSKLKVYPSVIDPLGNIYEIGVEGAKAFAKAHGLHQGHFSELLLGKAKSHKGWKIIT